MSVAEPQLAPGAPPGCEVVESVGYPASEFIGLTEAEAQALAAEKGYSYNVVCGDGHVGPSVMAGDVNANRLNLEVVDGIVRHAARY